jgi:hypothetical protein
MSKSELEIEVAPTLTGRHRSNLLDDNEESLTNEPQD